MTRGWLQGTVLAAVVAGVWGSGPAAMAAAGLEGNWRNPSGSVVTVYGCGSDLCLKIAQIEKGAPGTVDDNNPDASLRTRSLCGLEIGKGFHTENGGNKAEGGTLYDPKSGKTYSGSLEAEGSNRMKLRGYVGMKMFGRTEEWTRVEGAVGPCVQR